MTLSSLSDSRLSQPRRKHNKQHPAARHTTVIKVSLQRIPQDLKMCLDDEELDTDEKCTICLSMLEDGEDVRYTYTLNCFFIEKKCWFCRCEHKLCKQFVVSLGHMFYLSCSWLLLSSILKYQYINISWLL